jgi:geranylgeranyl diphosphate synthase type II
MQKIQRMNDFDVYRARVDNCLKTSLNRKNAPATLTSAMTYSVFNGGKRIRPILVYATTEALAGELHLSDSSACAVELIHCYSLVHDDLPAMDDDELRRGKPATHIEYDEATAILVGDALQALAFEVLSKDGVNGLQKVQELARAAGADGMVGGQILDIAAVETEISPKAIENMHLMKTGALIKASILMAACDHDLSGPQRTGLKRFAHHLGLAFQVRDDLLDVVGDQSIIGKTTGADQSLHKPTYVSIYGVAGAEKILADLHQEAVLALEGFDSKANKLRSVTDFVMLRDC